MDIYGKGERRKSISSLNFCADVFVVLGHNVCRVAAALYLFSFLSSLGKSIRIKAQDEAPFLSVI